MFSLIRFAIALALVPLLLSPIIGPALYVELRGVVAPGTTVAKREVIDVLLGTWTRRLFVDVRFEPQGAAEPEVTDVAVDATNYDRLRVGEPVQVLYAPNATLRQFRNVVTARLGSQRPLASFVARLGSLLSGLVVAFAVWCTLLWASSRWRRWWLSVAVVAPIFGGMVWLGSGSPWLPPAGALVAGSATVREVHQVTRVWESSRSEGEEAVQPYTIVELSFVPQGATDPVVAVDMVDAGSVPRLDKGVTVPVQYGARDPRAARIRGALRTYSWRNLRTLGLIATIIAAVLLLVWWTSRRGAVRRTVNVP